LGAETAEKRVDLGEAFRGTREDCATAFAAVAGEWADRTTR
jgi:hypothetical protein